MKQLVIIGGSFAEALEAGTDDEVNKWKGTRAKIDRGSMLLRRAVEKNVWNEMAEEETRRFLRGYLFCMVRSIQERILHGEKNVFNYVGRNVCKECARWMIDLEAAEFYLARCIPRTKQMKEWIEWRCKTPGEMVVVAGQVLKSVATWTEDEMAVLDGIQKDLEADLTAVCYWDLQQVNFIAECLMHEMHPKEGIVFFPNNSCVQYDAKEGIEVKIKLPEKYKLLYATVNDEGHNGVFVFDKGRKLVCFFDGYERRTSGKEYNKKKQAMKRDECCVGWGETAKFLLKMFGEIKDEGDFELSIGKEGKGDGNKEDVWQLMSASQGVEGGQSLLLRQNDDYSCGPVAIGHLVLALDEENGIKKNLERKDRDVGKFLTKIGLDEMMMKWVTGCTEGEEVKKEFPELFGGETMAVAGERGSAEVGGSNKRGKAATERSREDDKGGRSEGGGAKVGDMEETVREKCRIGWWCEGMPEFQRLVRNLQR